MVIKTKEEATANLETAISYIPARYEAGVKKADWATPAGSEAAEKNFADGISKAITAKSRQKGVKKISNTDWQNAAVNKGAPIIGSRMTAALDKYRANFGAVYDQVVPTVQGLKPRTTDFMANITNRLVPVVKKFKEAAGKL